MSKTRKPGSAIQTFRTWERTEDTVRDMRLDQLKELKVSERTLSFPEFIDAMVKIAEKHPGEIADELRARLGLPPRDQ